MLTNDIVSFEQLGPGFFFKINLVLCFLLCLNGVLSRAPDKRGFEYNSKIAETVLMRGQQYTAVLQCLEHLWNYEYMFETGVI